MSKTIKLTRGAVALVDDEDYEYLSQYNWQLTTDGYAQRGTWNKETKVSWPIRMHREIMKPIGKEQVDHINGNPLDNRRSNLRLCSYRENNLNRRKQPSKYSKYKGVTKVHGKYWAAQITADNEYKYLGYFKTELDAAKAYDKAALTYFKEFANINFKETA